MLGKNGNDKTNIFISICQLIKQNGEIEVWRNTLLPASQTLTTQYSLVTMTTPLRKTLVVW